MMEEGDLDFSLPDFTFSDLEPLEDTHGCIHTHICNPPAGTDVPHTHTCYHVHHKILPTPNDEETADSTEQNNSKKRPNGNRVAVKKYREKKKARTASLEEEVAHLRAVNQQLMKRLQGQAALEAEVARLRCLLVDIRGRIEGEIGTFPYQKPSFIGGVGGGGGGGAHIMNSCEGMRCVPCEIGNVQCMGSSNSGPNEVFVCAGGGGNGIAVGRSGNADKLRSKDAPTHVSYPYVDGTPLQNMISEGIL